METPNDHGLVGGSLERRLAGSRIPPLDLPYLLAPRRRDGDVERAREFVRHRPLHVEIGFGRPHHLLDLAASRPDAHVLGFETRRDWCRAASKGAVRRGLANVRAIEGDARTFFDLLLAGGSVDAIHVLFPDPWWKTRHHKRRIFQPSFVETAFRLLAPGGALVARTDLPAHADLIAGVVTAHGGFAPAGVPATDPELEALPRSHRAKKCRELGIPTWSFRFVKESPP